MGENEIKIGTQTWTSKNLEVSTYRNGDDIPLVEDGKKWKNLTTGAWCYYENKTGKGSTYGKLYNSYAVNDPRGLAPSGYHIPSDEEWTTLTNYLGGETIAGTKMKSSSGWGNNDNGTNTIGFAGLPGGYLNSLSGKFAAIGYYGSWWSSSEQLYTEANSPSQEAGLYKLNAWFYLLVSDRGHVYRNCNKKHIGQSVRCLRD